MQTLVSEFSSRQSGVGVHLTSYEENEMLYRLRHGALDADLIVFSRIGDVLSSKDALADLTSTAAFSRFNTYCSSFLGDEEGRVYCLPSPGPVFSYCANLDLIRSLNLSVPETVYDLSLLAKSCAEAEGKSAFASAWDKDNAPLDLFLQTCLTSYFSSTKGKSAFVSFALSGEKLSSSPSLPNFLSSINELKKLYSSGFYDPSLVGERAVDAFLEGKVALLSCSPQTNLWGRIENKSPAFSYKYLPFLGCSSSEALIPASCACFLSVAKAGIKAQKRIPIRDFTDFFVSEEGQGLLAKEESEDGRYRNFSHRKGSSFASSPDFAPLSNCLAKGRIFIIDRFVQVFSDCKDALASLAENSTSASIFVQQLDRQREEAVEKRSRQYDLFSLYDSSGSSLNDKWECLDKIASSLRRAYEADVTIIPSSFLQNEILGPELSETDLEAVFDKQFEIIPTLMSGSLLSEALLGVLRKRDLGYAYSGVKHSGGNFVLASGSPIKEKGEYLVYCPSEVLERLSEFPKSQGKPAPALEKLKEMWRKAA